MVISKESSIDVIAFIKSFLCIIEKWGKKKKVKKLSNRPFQNIIIRNKDGK